MWLARMSLPRVLRASLLNLGSGSAVRSTRVRARVVRGTRSGKESLAWRAASLADSLARCAGGDGRDSRGIGVEAR